MSPTKIVIFRICKAVGLFRLSRFLMRHRLLILCFHGFQLVDEARFRPMLFLRNSVLEQRLDRIQRSGFPVLSLEVGLSALSTGTLPHNAICITLDDGFFSVLQKAVPLLSRYDMPATLYLTSYYVDKETPIFRLVIQYMFWKTPVERLDLSDQSWGPNAPVPLQDEEARNRIGWEIIAYGESACSEEERQSICLLLGRRLQIDYEEILKSRILSLMTAEEISGLRAAGIDVQMHTHRHRLPLENDSEARREIRENRMFIERVRGQNKTHLCYPSGEWSTDQWPLLREEGIASAVTCEPGLNTSSTPLLGLYRILDQDDLPQIAFEAELFGFCELIRILTGKRHRTDATRHL